MNEGATVSEEVNVVRKLRPGNYEHTTDKKEAAVIVVNDMVIVKIWEGNGDTLCVSVAELEGNGSLHMFAKE